MVHECILLIWLIVILGICFQSTRLERSCPNEPNTFCADRYRIVITITPPTHLTFTTNSGHTGSTDIHPDFDILSYVIELRETATSDISEVNWLNRRATSQTDMTNDLANMDNSTNCDRLLYHTKAERNQYYWNNGSETSYIRYGEVPITSTDPQQLVSYSFVLNYYGQPNSGSSWNADAAIRPGNYLHARIYTLLENQFTDNPTVSNKGETENGIHFDDVLSFSEITPEPPNVTHITLGLVLADGDLELLEGTPVIPVAPIDMEVMRFNSERMLKVPSDPAKRANLNVNPHNDGFQNVKIREYKLDDDCAVDTGGRSYQLQLELDVDIPIYVDKSSRPFNNTDKNAIITTNVDGRNLLKLVDFAKTDEEIKTILNSRQTLSNPVDVFFLDIVDQLINTASYGAVFIPSTILLIESSDGRTNPYQLHTRVKFFQNKILPGSVGDNNQEYDDSDYTQESNLSNLQSSIGFIDDQSQISCRLKPNGETRRLRNRLLVYNGGYYDNPIASLTKKKM